MEGLRRQLETIAEENAEFQIRSVLHGKCLDISGREIEKHRQGAAAMLWDCYDTPHQRWTIKSDGSIRIRPQFITTLSRSRTPFVGKLR